MVGRQKTKQDSSNNWLGLVKTLRPGLEKLHPGVIFIVLGLTFLWLIFGDTVSSHIQETWPTEGEKFTKLTNKQAIADRCFVKYYLSGTDKSIRILNHQESKITIGTNTGVSTNTIASCSLEWTIKNDIGSYTGNINIYPKIQQGSEGIINYTDIFSGMSLNPIYSQNLYGEVICLDIDSSIPCTTDSVKLSYTFPKSYYSGKILVIDGSENKYITKDGKSIIIELRKMLSGSINSEMKVMWAKGLRNKNNVIFFNSKYMGNIDFLNQIEQLFQEITSKYNDIPFILVPMSIGNYKQEVDLWYLNDCTRYDKRFCVEYNYEKMNTELNVYDLRFLDEKLNYNLDFWLFLASPK